MIMKHLYRYPPIFYINVASNDTPEGRVANRRTRIVILPQPDQFFRLPERKD